MNAIFQNGREDRLTMTRSQRRERQQHGLVRAKDKPGWMLDNSLPRGATLSTGEWPPSGRLLPELWDVPEIYPTDNIPSTADTPTNSG